MFLLIEMTKFASVKALLVGIPESVELFVFGIALIVAVMMLRWFLNRNNNARDDDKGLTNN